MIAFNCPKCGQFLDKIPNEWAGKLAVCKHCGKQVTIPNPSTELTPSVFISHSSADREFVERHLIPFLDGNGIDTWYSKESIQTSEEWERAILRGLEQSDWFLLVMTRAASESRWVKAEVDWAMKHRQGRFVPLLIEDCDPYAFHLWLPQLQHLDFQGDPKGAGQRLVRVLCGDESIVLEGAPMLAEVSNSQEQESVVTVELVRTLRHQGYVASVDMNPDGTIIASGSFDATIQLWNAETGKPLHTFHSVTQGSVKRFLWWTLGRETRHPIMGAAFSPDGQTIAAYGRHLMFWEVSTGGLLRTIHAGEDGVIDSIAFSPDGHIIASTFNKYPDTYRIDLRDVATGNLLRVLDGYDTHIQSVAFSPDGTTIASGGGKDNKVKLRDIETGRFPPARSGMTRNRGFGGVHINAIAFSPDGTMIASGSSSYDGHGTIDLWESSTGSLIRNLGGHGGNARCVAFSPQGNLLATGGDDGRIMLWNPKKQGMLLELEDAHVRQRDGSRRVTSVTFSSNGRLLVSGGMDGTVKVWSIEQV